ncbi:MAG: N-acetyltransferase [Candidatus Kapabacteria bacterium]|nr:N-acetyltransferase [Candidatus Kapabacteria bacterium]
MDIHHHLSSGGGAWSILDAQQGKVVAELRYSISDAILVIESVWVDVSLRGKGVGKKLVETAIEYAREHNIKVHPVCSFASALFDAHAVEWSDVRS